MDWTHVTKDTALAEMPVALVTPYAQYLAAYPDRATILDDLVLRVVEEFRAAIMSNPENVLDPDATKLPLPCIRPAMTIIWHNLALETGPRPAEEAVQTMIRAEMYLRSMRYSFSTRDGVAPSPHYTTDHAEPARGL